MGPKVRDEGMLDTRCWMRGAGDKYEIRISKFKVQEEAFLSFLWVISVHYGVSKGRFFDNFAQKVVDYQIRSRIIVLPFVGFHGGRNVRKDAGLSHPIYGILLRGYRYAKNINHFFEETNMRNVSLTIWVMVFMATGAVFADLDDGLVAYYLY